MIGVLLPPSWDDDWGVLPPLTEEESIALGLEKVGAIIGQALARRFDEQLIELLKELNKEGGSDANNAKI